MLQAFVLHPATVSAQDGCIPIQKDREKLMEVCHTSNPHEVRIFNARAVAKTPILTTIGFKSLTYLEATFSPPPRNNGGF